MNNTIETKTLVHFYYLGNQWLLNRIIDAGICVQ